MSSKPKPKLHDDILILIVEKIFFQEPEGVGDKAIDLRKENPYTFFMAHKPITETAFITQFAKLRRVEFRNVYMDKRTIEFHKDEEQSVANQNAVFTGPWRVSNMLLEEIIKRKKFRVTNVATRWYFRDREACELGTNASSLEAFCALFLGKKLDITDSMKNDYDLAIKKLEMNEDPEDIKKNFEAILAINSKELVFDLFDEDLFSICSSLPRSQITADKTIKITIKSRVGTDKFVSNSMSYANFLIENCPNLTTLHFHIRAHINHHKGYFDRVYTILNSFMNEFLNPLDKGHSDLKICLTCDVVFAFEESAYDPYYNIPKDYDHELFTLGTEFTTDCEDDSYYMKELEMARIIKVADAKGREHECILKIFIEPIYDLSYWDLDSSDDNNADFDDYTDSDDNDEEEMDMN